MSIESSSQRPSGEAADAQGAVVDTVYDGVQEATTQVDAAGFEKPAPGAVFCLREFGVTFPAQGGEDVVASQQINLDLIKGQVLALVGESGSGKSVTAMGALGLLSANALVSGSAVLDCCRQNQELVGAAREILDQVRGEHVGVIFQEPTTALDPLFTIGDQIAEAIAIHGEGKRKRTTLRQRRAVRTQVLNALSRAGLGGDQRETERIADSYPHQLSGGQLQRACIALATANSPSVLIADEPTTALDVTVQAEILDLLRQLASEGVAVLLITHDMGVVADVADAVAVMRHGRIIERGDVRTIFASPSHDYTRQLLAAVPRLNSLRGGVGSGADSGAGDGGAAVSGAGLAKVAAVNSDDAASEGDGVASRVGDSAQPLVHIENLDVVYRNGRRHVHAVRGVSFDIARGQVLGLVGESGSGKSTIAGTLTGLVPIHSGSVQVDGLEVAGASGRKLRGVRSQTGIVFQNPASSLNPRRSVGASIGQPLQLHTDLTNAQRRQRVNELLEAVRLPASMAQRYPHEMSGGQRQRVAIARALALQPKLLIADEPTSALDVSVQAVVLELLANLQHELGFACLFVSHDLAVVEQVASQVVVLRQGQVVEAGKTTQVLSAPSDPYTQALVAAVPVPDPIIQAQRRARRASALRAA
ncbi:MAG: ABC transporter ATP-binding protein [Actinomyces graevenitzii]|nr:ABC transporter ATP-binding protein [Actinomyces graevenitzii]